MLEISKDKAAHILKRFEEKHKDVTWASNSDLAEVDAELLERVIEASYYYCYDAANLVYEFHSSTSGMYGSWQVKVSGSCTVYTNKKAPVGTGKHINIALAEFIVDCVENDQAYENGERETCHPIESKGE